MVHGMLILAIAIPIVPAESAWLCDYIVCASVCPVLALQSRVHTICIILWYHSRLAASLTHVLFPLPVGPMMVFSPGGSRPLQKGREGGMQKRHNASCMVISAYYAIYL